MKTLFGECSHVQTCRLIGAMSCFGDIISYFSPNTSLYITAIHAGIVEMVDSKSMVCCRTTKSNEAHSHKDIFFSTCFFLQFDSKITFYIKFWHHKIYAYKVCRYKVSIVKLSCTKFSIYKSFFGGQHIACYAKNM